MSLLTKHAIPIGATGSVCYILQVESLSSLSISELKNLGIKNILVAKEFSEEVGQFEKDSFRVIFLKGYLLDSDINHLDESSLSKNFALIYKNDFRTALINSSRLICFIDASIQTEDLDSYFSSNYPEYDLKEQLLSIKKELDDKFFHIKKTEIKLKKKDFSETKSTQILTSPKLDVVTDLNLSALNMDISEESIFSTNPKIEFNIESLTPIPENEFKQESTLDLDLTNELNFIDDLQTQDITQETDSINIDTVPIVNEPEKKYIDFHNIIDQELESEQEEQELLFGKSGLSEEDFLSKKSLDETSINIDEIISEELSGEFEVNEEFLNSEIELNLDLPPVDLDLSFPPPVDDSKSILQPVSEVKLDIDPTHTFISRRIDTILKDVLEEGKKIEEGNQSSQFKAIPLD
jgi:hypothetical protein